MKRLVGVGTGPEAVLDTTDAVTFDNSRLQNEGRKRRNFASNERTFSLKIVYMCVPGWEMEGSVGEWLQGESH